METTVLCPECGYPLTIDETAGVEYEYFAGGFHNPEHPLPTKIRTTPVAFCMHCEFAHELLPASLSALMQRVDAQKEEGVG
jgi:hypothetical protein